MGNVIFDRVTVGNKKNIIFSVDELTVPSEHIIAVVGAKDVGKTEFINLLIGKEKAMHGSVTVDGGAVPSLDKHELFYVDESTYLPAFSSVSAIMDKFQKEYPSFSREVAEKYLSAMQIPTLKVNYRNFNRMVQCAINCIMAIASRAKVTVFDQPCRDLNLKLRAMMSAFAKEDFAEMPRTMIISSNIAIDVDKVADYVVYLRNKKVMFGMPYEDVDKFAVGLLGNGDIIKQYTEEENTFYHYKKSDGLVQALVRNNLTPEQKQALALNGVITQYVNLVNFHAYIVKEAFGLDEITRSGQDATQVEDKKAHSKHNLNLKKSKKKGGVTLIAKETTSGDSSKTIKEEKKETFGEKLKRILTTDLF